MEQFLEYLPQICLGLIAIFFIGAEVIKSFRVWKEERDNRIQSAIDQKQHDIDIANEFKKIHERFDDLAAVNEDSAKRLEAVETTVNNLVESDKNDIRAWIVEQYHKFYVHQGWIDAFSADTIEKRYADYKKEGGNSYVEELIKRLHSLPMDPQGGVGNLPNIGNDSDRNN